MKNLPIGFIDSGVGGLTVVKQSLRQLPNESIIYLGDNARCPYGPRPLEEVKKYPSEDVYIIGGESVYKQMMPYCDVAHITKIDMAYDADAYHPNLDADPQWKEVAWSDEQVYFDLTYHFVKYERV